MALQFLEIPSDESWLDLFHAQMELLEQIDGHLQKYSMTKIIYPDKHQIFRVFNECPLTQIKAVILGQDPYHGEGEAEGMAFSVPQGMKRPPSLRNIFRELQDDLHIEIDKQSSSLEPWLQQGVFLLNSILSVEKDTPGCHAKIGWESFTDHCIRYISQNVEHAVFILWGKYAQKKQKYIDKERHLILTSAHPSPLGARYGFWQSKPFSKTNEFLQTKGMTPIQWQI